MTDEKNMEGWGKPYSSRKFHYFREKRSLCGRYAHFVKDDAPYGIELEQGWNEHSENCAQCQRRKLAEVEDVRPGQARKPVE